MYEPIAAERGGRPAAYAASDAYRVRRIEERRDAFIMNMLGGRSLGYSGSAGAGDVKESVEMSNLKTAVIELGPRIWSWDVDPSSLLARINRAQGIWPDRDYGIFGATLIALVLIGKAGLLLVLMAVLIDSFMLPAGWRWVNSKILSSPQGDSTASCS
jgi:hypothetical protein